ncbi:hypothetical protein B0T17DRAFT_106661 [Bombardia bombarda]|uniref:Uncharacterized protein n=1 Tax=Bombardia bombarda TaxID=252184 RepID=A0AA39XNK3_9PEZI|nr:hypothetical protein B0T17DRAFT_106661 [Bombardia bombarda]
MSTPPAYGDLDANAIAPESRDPTINNAINTHKSELTELMQPWSLDRRDGSVLAIVTMPPDTGSSLSMACNGQRWKDLYLRMDFDKLSRLGSSKINDLLVPKAQERFRRRHAALSAEIKHYGMDYIIDLTPPTEGGELADLLSTLWLPKMVKLWFLAGRFFPDPIIQDGPVQSIHDKRPLAEKAVGAILSLGHDDVCRSRSCLSDYHHWMVDDDVPGIIDDDKYIPSFRRIEDYCPIRHRVAIMRILRAVNSHSLLINSAARMWTVAQVAIHLEIPQVVVDPITQWLIAPPNTKFIEICPEKAFQLALKLKIPSVLTSAFRILVSERAVDLADDDFRKRNSKTTWIGRKRDDYGDFPSDPIEYASRNMVDRMNGILERLKADDVFSNLGTRNSQWEKLLNLGPSINTSGSPELQKSYAALIDALITTWKKHVARGLREDYIRDHLKHLIEAQRAHYLTQEERKAASLVDLYRGLNPLQTFLAPFFWDYLKDPYWLIIVSTLEVEQRVYEFNQSVRNAIIGGRITVNPSSDDDFSGEFNLKLFQNRLQLGVQTLCNRVLERRTNGATTEEDIPCYLSDHLILSLDDKEFNYLPMWAGGLDDETGGVFQDAIPPAEMGPSEPGPGYHTGHTVATDTDTMTIGGGPSTVAASDMGFRNLEIASVARSMDAEQSITTIGPARNVVMAAPSITSSEQFSASHDMHYGDAMFAQPAAHQAQGQAIVQYVESDSDSATMSQGFTASNDGNEEEDESMSHLPEVMADDSLSVTMDEDDDFMSDNSSSTLGESDFDML